MAIFQPNEPFPYGARWVDPATGTLTIEAQRYLQRGFQNSDFTQGEVEGVQEGKADKSITITGVGDLGGGGDLSANREITHDDSGVTAGDYTNANITVNARGHVTAAASGASGAAAWSLLDQSGAPISITGSTWTHSANVASIAVTGLSTYNELLIIARGITASLSGNRGIQVSTDNGATWLSTPGTDYVDVDANGVQGNNAFWGGHSTASTASRSFMMNGFNLKGAVKFSTASATSRRFLFISSNSDINAIRLANYNVATGAVTGTMNAGTFYVFAR